MDTLFRPITVEKKPKKIADHILEYIASGQLEVGDKIPAERKLAESLNVSRASLREALSYLEISGFLKTVPGGRTLVKNIIAEPMDNPLQILLKDDKKKILELAEIRAFMESWSARQAALNRTTKQLRKIEKYLGEMEEDFNRGIIDFKKDLNFHLAIAAAVNNTIFSHLINMIYDLIEFSIQSTREKLYTSREDQELILKHHRNIYETIRVKDPVYAELAMQEHLGFVIREFKKRFK